MYRTICLTGRLAAVTSTLFCGLSSSWSSWHFLKVFDYIYLIFLLFPSLIKALLVEESASEPCEPYPANLVSLCTTAAVLRDQIALEKELYKWIAVIKELPKEFAVVKELAKKLQSQIVLEYVLKDSSSENCISEISIRQGLPVRCSNLPSLPLN